MKSVVKITDLGELWKVGVSKAYVGLRLRQEWGAQLYVAGPTGRWRKIGYPVVSADGPLEAVEDLLAVLRAGELRARGGRGA